MTPEEAKDYGMSTRRAPPRGPPPPARPPPPPLTSRRDATRRHRRCWRVRVASPARPELLVAWQARAAARRRRELDEICIDSDAARCGCSQLSHVVRPAGRRR